MKKQKHGATLPKRAPKKTGKRGIGPREFSGDLTEQDRQRSEKEAEPKTPRQARLPGVEDPEIEELEAAALDYVEVRDARQALTPKEVEAKEKLLSLMKANDKTVYRHGGIEITRTVEKEKIRVRVKKESAEE